MNTTLLSTSFKNLILIIFSTLIILLIYLGMAYITMTPRAKEMLEIDDAIDVVNREPNKTKTVVKSNKSPLIVKPVKPLAINDLKTKILSGLHKEQSKVIKNIDSKELIPALPTNLIKAADLSMSDININSKQMKPLYPYEAYKNNIKGWVLLKLFISETGKVFDVEVLDSSPKGIFEHIAIQSAYKKEFPMNKNVLNPKVYTRNIKMKYNPANE